MSGGICPNPWSCGHDRCAQLFELDQHMEELAAEAAMYASIYVQQHSKRVPKHTSILTGHLWFQELWDGNDHRFFEQMRMNKVTFSLLMEVLSTQCGLLPTRHVELQESIAIFLRLIGAGNTFNDLQERFQRSSSTIGSHYSRVLESVCLLGDMIIAPSDPTFNNIPDHILQNDRYYPYFANCIGAIDGTHITVRLSEGCSRDNWINRHGNPSTNVLAICDFNLEFIYAVVGKEGSIHDARMLTEARADRRVPFSHPPPGKYCIADSGYAQRTVYLTPYKSRRYHLEQFRRVNSVIENKEENFNYVHASLRSIIERAFGVLKMRFQVLKCMPRFSKNKQIKMIWACMALHNFLRRYAVDDLDTLHCMPSIGPVEFEVGDVGESSHLADEDDDGGFEVMSILRDQICDALPLVV